jgi:hypothetical protein
MASVREPVLSPEGRRELHRLGEADAFHLRKFPHAATRKPASGTVIEQKLAREFDGVRALMPTRRRIAINSASLNALAPSRASFSRGRLTSGSS